MGSDFVGSLLMALGVFILGVIVGAEISNSTLREDVKLCIEGHKPSCDKLEEMFRIKEWR